MDRIRGFPFLHKAPSESKSRTQVTCQNCGAVVIVEESLWVNEYTNEPYIWCQSCTTLVGMWHQPDSSQNSRTNFPDSTLAGNYQALAPE